MTVQQALVLGFGVGIAATCALLYGWHRWLRQQIAFERRLRTRAEALTQLCLKRVGAERPLCELLVDRAALINIRMDVQNAKEDYAGDMHPRMMRLVDGLLDATDTVP